MTRDESGPASETLTTLSLVKCTIRASRNGTYPGISATLRGGDGLGGANWTGSRHAIDFVQGVRRRRFGFSAQVLQLTGFQLVHLPEERQGLDKQLLRCHESEIVRCTYYFEVAGAMICSAGQTA